MGETSPIRLKYLHPPEIIRRSEYEHADERRVANWVLPWDFSENLDAGIIGVPMAQASPYWKGVSEAPNAVREAFARFTTYNPDFDVDIQALRVRDIGDVEMHPTDVASSHERILATLRELCRYRHDFIPIIIGGDHSVTRPALRGFREGRGEKVGLIHFDAHDDLRTFDWGGPTSGTPIRGILEDGSVDGRNLVQVGLHGFANSRDALQYGKSRGARCITAREIRKRGIRELMDEALGVAAERTEAIYVSLDIDVLEPAFAPGTGGPVSGGMAPWDLLDAVYYLGRCPQVKALDLVCIDPLKDVKDLTVKMGCSVILTFLGGVYSRKCGEGVRL